MRGQSVTTLGRRSRTAQRALEREEIKLHGHTVTYRRAGWGPLVVLIHRAGDAVGGFMRRLGLRAGADLDEMWRGFTSLGDAGARNAFIHTLRGLIEPGGQRVNATDRLYLAERMPTMLIWGERDPIIPVRHGRAASEMIPGARFEVFPDARHFPHRDEPRRFVKVLSDFIETTEPAHVTDAD